MLNGIATRVTVDIVLKARSNFISIFLGEFMSVECLTGQIETSQRQNKC